MPEIPDELKRNNRPRDKEFDLDEYLYRRVHPKDWHETNLRLAAIPLPDMSTNRSKYSRPEWTRLESEETADWAVVGFKVGDIPSEMMHLGTERCTFEPHHTPLDENFSHSEVWAFKDGKHIQAKRDLDPELHTRWRIKLRWKIKTFLRPNEMPPGDA